MAVRYDPEYDVVVEDREATKEYIEGFGWKAILGGFFVGFLIVPGGMFMSLMIGQGLGAAADWVTLLLFLHIAKRCRTELTKSEMFLIFSVAGGVLGMATGGMFGGFIRMQFLMQSEAAQVFGIADQVPLWVAPPAESEAYRLRSLLHRDWWPHITIMGISLAWGRLNFYSLGYFLFRVTSDVERLPFPMAPIATEGITALAEADKESWRWSCFTIGSTVGIAFAAIYITVPILTGLLFNERLELITMPFYDYTGNIEDILPAVPARISSHLGQIFAGFVLPFWMIIGSAMAGLIGQCVGNPILYKLGVLERWEPGMGAIATEMANSLDFWMAFQVGTGIGVALVGFWNVYRAYRKDRAKKAAGDKGPGLFSAPKGRGDIPVKASLLLYFVSTSGTIMLCHYLVPKFPVWVLIVFGFFYTPFMSYVSARMVGLTGHGVGFPYVKEATFVLSGYKGVDIWSAPIPLGNAGGSAQYFRQIELTGTKISSLFKAGLFEIPLALVVSLVFWSFIWRMGEIPSAIYPYALRFWPMQAVGTCLWWTATTTGNAFFLQVMNPWYIGYGVGFALVGYTILASFGLPILLIYGFIRGLLTSPFDAIPEVTAACLGRFVFARKFGRAQWKRYTYVLSAGFGAGMGLMTMATAAIQMISKAITELPY